VAIGIIGLLFLWFVGMPFILLALDQQFGGELVVLFSLLLLVFGSAFFALKKYMWSKKQ